MSLYTHEEICEGCVNAIFHECCNKFCHCIIDAEGDVNCYNGTCESKVNKEDNETD